MELSRFVVSYPNVRPGEHVLYSVLEDRYVGVDELTLSAVARWKAGAAAADAELETQSALVDDGILVHSRADDDPRPPEHPGKDSEGIPRTLFVPLMPTLQCNLAR